MTCHPSIYPFIGHHEGKVLKAYLCPAHVVTIGFGFTMGSRIFAAWWIARHGRGLRLGDTILLSDALYLLKQVVDLEYLKAVEKAAPNASPQAKGASASMAFNCGLGALKWSWFRFLIAGDVANAAARLRVTGTTAKGRRLPGLVRRRAEEADILGRNKWPSWLKVESSLPKTIEAMPPLQSDDFNQGIKWLTELGYFDTGNVGAAREIIAATRRFQADHKQLTVDGIMGRATLDQLQRSIDLKRKLAQTTTGGGVVATGGGGASVTDTAGQMGEWVMVLGLSVIVIGGLWLAWRYRDEIKTAFGRKRMA